MKLCPLIDVICFSQQRLFINWVHLSCYYMQVVCFLMPRSLKPNFLSEWYEIMYSVRTYHRMVLQIVLIMCTHGYMSFSRELWASLCRFRIPLWYKTKNTITTMRKLEVNRQNKTGTQKWMITKNRRDQISAKASQAKREKRSVLVNQYRVQVLLLFVMPRVRYLWVLTYIVSVY